MSFFSNFQSDKCPGNVSGNPLNGLCEKVCIQVQKIFDAGIKQIQLDNYILTLDETPPATSFPLTFISARSTTSVGVISNLNVERVHDKPGCARVQATVGIPIEVLYTDVSGMEGSVTATVTVNQDVLLFVPAPSIMPYQVTAEVSAVGADGTFDCETGTFTIGACLTVIMKIALDVQLLVPTYGYCAIPPSQDYSQEVCAGFFELPLYPQGKNCSNK